MNCQSSREHGSILSVTGGPGAPRGQAGSYRSPRPWWGAGQTRHRDPGVAGPEGAGPPTRPLSAALGGADIPVGGGWAPALFPVVPNWCGRCAKPRGDGLASPSLQLSANLHETGGRWPAAPGADLLAESGRSAGPAVSRPAESRRRAHGVGRKAEETRLLRFPAEAGAGLALRTPRGPRAASAWALVTPGRSRQAAQEVARRRWPAAAASRAGREGAGRRGPAGAGGERQVARHDSFSPTFALLAGGDRGRRAWLPLGSAWPGARGCKAEPTRPLATPEAVWHPAPVTPAPHAQPLPCKPG